MQKCLWRITEILICDLLLLYYFAIIHNTDLSFEKSEVDADINGSIQSVKNPISGHITADFIGEIIIEQETDCKIMIR